MAAIEKKLVIIGDGACGKKSLLSVLSKDLVPGPDFDPPVIYEQLFADIEVDGQQVKLELWETINQVSLGGRHVQWKLSFNWKNQIMILPLNEISYKFSIIDSPSR